MVHRFGFALAALTIVMCAAALPARSVAADVAFTVSVSPLEEPVPLGGKAVFRLRIEGNTASVPTLDFDVNGGNLAGVASINPTAANLAEGAVFVTRDSAGTATLRVSLGGEQLATGSATFAQVGSIAVAVNLDAGLDAAARTWRYEVLSARGEVVDSIRIGVSGDAPRSIRNTRPLPLGVYVVRQVASADLRSACGEGAFYQLVSPASGERVVTLESSIETAEFTIRPCAASAPAPATDGSSVSEVSGAREAGPLVPLPPRTGNSRLANAPKPTTARFLLLAGAFVTLCSPGVWVVTRKSSVKR